MFINFVVLFLLLGLRSEASQQDDIDFTYNGFRGVDMSLDGLAQITNDGLLMVVNTSMQQKGHAFYPHPIHFMNSSSGSVFSFSTTFVFAMFSEFAVSDHPGMAFIIAHSRNFSSAWPSIYLGVFNKTNNGKSSNHVIAIEMDSIQNLEFDDIDSNHVGIDINDLKSVDSAPASYFSDQENRYVNLTLSSGRTLQLWVEYCGVQKQLNVTLAPFEVPKPKIPLLSFNIDLSPIIVDPMFVGFSSSTAVCKAPQYVLGWSFKMNGKAKDLSPSQLPKLPRMEPKAEPRIFTIAFPVIGASLVFMSIFIIQIIVAKRKKFAEVYEDWELEYAPQRFKYKDLYIATKGFDDKELLGSGGFGNVYKGILLTSKVEVAVKRVSHDSRQGVKEFIAEIVSIGKLQHRNIVTLLGYCRRKGELLLVYDFMPNGSLDKILFDQSPTKPTLSWKQRFQIIKSVASALLYLHEEWEQVVVHRDIKSSNVMLDRELNARLGDFGLARLYDHGGNPKSTHVVGTFGYIAPELYKTGKANPSVDVFAFGVFLLEVACGRRPIEPRASEDCLLLVEWVISCLSRGVILETVDPKLGMNHEVEETELVLKLGLLCSHSIPTARPSMRQVVRYLEGEAPLPELSIFMISEGTSDDVSTWFPSCQNAMTPQSSIADSLLSGGR
ncbi:L-type lectin-domain containing receptor kinase IV.2-like [Macadamia integrifolia]|uniref:L-type lectin-domain containing receptor kinase IV.2-like n=1 Tax=Macadamia integrifolia TaxID=60698 RepID=UPI001C52B591|nr:L-type lectin-domain containing receptor kinase IV.2-like [Macadamia integrifolia]